MQWSIVLIWANKNLISENSQVFINFLRIHISNASKIYFPINFSGYIYLSIIDTLLVSSAIAMVNIVFGFFCTIGMVTFVGLIQALIQHFCYDRQGFRCFEHSAFTAFGPLLSIVHEIKRDKKMLLIIFNRLFIYIIMCLILLGSTMALDKVNKMSFFNHLSRTSNSDCNNLCYNSYYTIGSCKHFQITKGVLHIWAYFNWFLYAFSCINAIGLLVFRKNDFSPVRQQEFDLRPI